MFNIAQQSEMNVRDRCACTCARDFASFGPRRELRVGDTTGKLLSGIDNTASRTYGAVAVV
jgi:hypothetical protein